MKNIIKLKKRDFRKVSDKKSIFKRERATKNKEEIKMSLVQVLSVKLQRTDQSTSWGFNVQGGKEFHSPLVIQKVRLFFYYSLFLNLGHHFGFFIR